MMLLFYLVQLLIPLVVFGVPIALGVRWIVKRRENAWRMGPADLPTREQFATLVEQVDRLATRLEEMGERQLFFERLLEAPKTGTEERLGAARSGDDSA